MFTTYNPPWRPDATAQQSEPAYRNPTDPHSARRTLNNVLPKRGFKYIDGQHAFPDIPTRNVVLDAMRNFNGIVHNITPRVVDGLLESLILHLTKHVQLMAVVGYPEIFRMLQKQKTVGWITNSGITSGIADQLVLYLVKGRLRAKAISARESHTPSLPAKKKVELCKTAVAIDAYILSLGKAHLAERIPILDDDDDDLKDTSAAYGDLESGSWDAVLTLAKMEADAEYQRVCKASQHKKEAEKADLSANVSTGKQAPHGTKRQSSDHDQDEISLLDDLAADMSTLAFEPNHRPVKDTKRRLVDFKKMQHHPTKVVTEEVLELTSRIQSFNFDENSRPAAKEVEEKEEETAVADDSESEVSEYNSESDEDW